MDGTPHDVLDAVRKAVLEAASGPLPASPAPERSEPNAPRGGAPIPLPATLAEAARAEPLSDSLEDHARAAILSATAAVAEPWLSHLVPRILEAQLGATLGPRVDGAIAEALDARLAPEIGRQLAGLEEKSAAALSERVAASVAAH